MAEDKKLKEEALKQVTGGNATVKCERNISNPSSKLCAGCEHLCPTGEFAMIDGKPVPLYKCTLPKNGKVVGCFPGLVGFP